jgi:hypothetical protein
MPMMTPEERQQFGEQLQQISELLDKMGEVEALREGLTVEEFNRKYEFPEGW